MPKKGRRTTGFDSIRKRRRKAKLRRLMEQADLKKNNEETPRRDSNEERWKSSSSSSTHLENGMNMKSLFWEDEGTACGYNLIPITDELLDDIPYEKPDLLYFNYMDSTAPLNEHSTETGEVEEALSSPNEHLQTLFPEKSTFEVPMVQQNVLEMAVSSEPDAEHFVKEETDIYMSCELEANVKPVVSDLSSLVVPSFPSSSTSPPPSSPHPPPSSSPPPPSPSPPPPSPPPAPPPHLPPPPQESLTLVTMEEVVENIIAPFNFYLHGWLSLTSIPDMCFHKSVDIVKRKFTDSYENYQKLCEKLSNKIYSYLNEVEIRDFNLKAFMLCLHLKMKDKALSTKPSLLMLTSCLKNLLENYNGTLKGFSSSFIQELIVVEAELNDVIGEAKLKLNYPNGYFPTNIEDSGEAQ